MAEKVTETALERTVESSTELQPSQSSTSSLAEIKGAIYIAREFPRNEDVAFQKLMKSCLRTSFAEEVNYGFPRGGNRDCAHEWDWEIERCKICNATLVNGPSVNLAREAARVWGNNRSGVRVLNDTDETRLIEGWAWDLETNRQVSAQTQFSKLVYRKGRGWIVPDERDLRELTNRHAAILVRNCLLEILPKDLIEDACDEAVKTMTKNATEDPDGQRKAVILGFSELNVSVEMLEASLGHKVGTCSPTELAKLKAIYKSIANGQSNWADYGGKLEANGKAPEPGKPADAAKPASTVQGEPTKDAAAAPQNGEKEKDRKLNKTESDLIVRMAKKKQMTDDALHTHLIKHFGVPFADILKSQYDAVLNSLSASM